MESDRGKNVLLTVGIPLTLWMLLADHAGVNFDVRLTVALIWFGAGTALYLLSRNRGQPAS